MKYVEISNIGEISKQAMELLGFSDKRNRTDLIGEKGTGLKFSRMQCLRRAIQFFVTTNSFKSYYSKKKIDEENDQVVFRYELKNGKKHAKPSSFTVQAGFSDWTDDWFIVREVVQNAVDEMVRGGVCKERDEAMRMVVSGMRVVDKVCFAKKGNTNTYIELTPSIEKVFTTLNEYFVYNPLFSCKHGGLHKKKDKEKVKVYKQGIFVQDYALNKSLYDYDCSRIQLQENRTPKYSNDVADEALKIYNEAPIEFKRELLRWCNFNENAIELKWAWSHTNVLEKLDEWEAAFRAEFGERAVIHNTISIPEHVEEKMKMHKKVVVVLADPMYSFLKRRIQTLEELSSSYEELMYHVVEPDSRQKNIIDRALSMLSPLFTKEVSVKMFKPNTELEHNTSGVYLPSKNKILINNNRVSSLEELLPILIEEKIHAETGADDFTRAFQNAAISRLSRALLENS